MCKISYRRHRFPPIIIQHAVWLYCRFTLSYRDVEDLLVERGLDLSYETVRRWVLKFGRACLSRKTALAMAFKLILSARRKWRKLDGSNQLAELVEGVPFKDGIKITKHAA